MATTTDISSTVTAVASSSKRKAETLLKPTAKMAKTDGVYPLFSNAKASTSQQPSIRWLPDLGNTCLHGTHRDPPALSKVAMFDLDGTLIRPKNGRKWPRGADDWEWLHARVKRKLRDISEDGFSVVIISNQAGFSQVKAGGSRRTEWKKKMGQIAAQLPDVPLRIFAASGHDKYRKPLLGMWDELEAIYQERGIAIDKKRSYFVGDAAGRPGDHSCTDRQFALNVGVKFFTPEEYFHDGPPEAFTLTGFNPSLLSDSDSLPLFSPSNTPLIPDPSSSSNPPTPAPEIILFVGYPSAGKTSFFRKHLAPHDYIHINQDTLGSIDKCLKMVRARVGEGRRCVVDNTNRDVATRAKYLAIGEEMGVPVRCFNFATPKELAMHNNIYRAYFAPYVPEQPRTPLLPPSAFSTFTAAYEVPTLGEGFREVKTINWVWDGSEEERARWEIWT